MTFPDELLIVILLLGMVAHPTPTQAQTNSQDIPGCQVFESCALRVRYGLLRTEVVRGSDSDRVARIGLGTPPLEELFSRADRASVSFDQFRVDHRRSSWMKVLGGIEIVGGLVAGAQDNEDWAVALSISGILIEVAARVFDTKANEHLSDAIWWYNESLARGGVR